MKMMTQKSHAYSNNAYRVSRLRSISLKLQAHDHIPRENFQYNFFIHITTCGKFSIMEVDHSAR